MAGDDDIASRITHQIAGLVHLTALPLLSLHAIELPAGSTAFANLAHVHNAALLRRWRRIEALHSQHGTDALHVVQHPRLVTSILTYLHAS